VILPLLGLSGSLLMTIAGPRLVDSAGSSWWYLVNIPPGRAGNMIAFYVGLAGLVLAWLGLGRRLSHEMGARPGELWVVALLWGAPLAVGPALFSGDMYSYLAQGAILHLGLDPYHVVPLVLARHGERPLLDAVSPFWRSTTAPYGPLFLGLVSVIVDATGSHVVAGILAVRLLEIVGVGLLAVYVPRLARALGADPCRATWLAVASPLVLLELVAAGHNDALMTGLMVAGVSLAFDGRPLVGVWLCSLASTVKVPAGAAALFIAVCWWRERPGRGARLRFALAAVAVAGAVTVVVSGVTGLGLGWISTTLVSTPAKVRLAITPATELGWTAARLLHAAGVAVNAHHLESAFGVVGLVVTAAVAAVLLWRARLDDMVLYLAAVLVVAAFGGPAAWPWYFCWGLALLAAWPGVQRSGAVAIAVAGSVFLVKPDGILGLPLDYAPVALAVYLAVAALALRQHRREHDAPSDGRGERNTLASY
jgi:hypothetical protein